VPSQPRNAVSAWGVRTLRTLGWRGLGGMRVGGLDEDGRAGKRDQMATSPWGGQTQ
jgi:hypothetical protein